MIRCEKCEYLSDCMGESFCIYKYTSAGNIKDKVNRKQKKKKMKKEE